MTSGAWKIVNFHVNMSRNQQKTYPKSFVCSQVYNTSVWKHISNDFPRTRYSTSRFHDVDISISIEPKIDAISTADEAWVVRITVSCARLRVGIAMGSCNEAQKGKDSYMGGPHRNNRWREYYQIGYLTVLM